MSSSYTQVYIHLVWATWDRLPLLTRGVRESVYACIRTECKSASAKVIALGGTEDHVHLFIELPTTLAVADLVKQVKGSSSHFANYELHVEPEFRWQGSYAAFGVSKSLGPVVREYITNQGEHHKNGTTSKDAELAWETKPGIASSE